MSETQFTKGKWRVQRTENISGQNVWEVVTDAYDVCSCDFSIRTKHNADLIAAAPEMYKALDETNNELKAAIDKINQMMAAKITPTTENEPDLWDQQTLHENAILLAKARGDL